MEDAVLTLAAASEIDLSTALRELQNSRRRVQRAVAKWKADDDGGGTHTASLALDHESLVAIAFYTSNGVFAAMNAALRSGQRRRVLPFLPYLKLILQVRGQFLLLGIALRFMRGGLGFRVNIPTGAEPLT
jgi:hypothetical protein